MSKKQKTPGRIFAHDAQEPHYMPTFREHRNETANPRALPSHNGPLKRSNSNGAPMVARSAVFAAAKKLKSCVFWAEKILRFRDLCLGWWIHVTVSMAVCDLQLGEEKKSVAILFSE